MWQLRWRELCLQQRTIAYNSRQGRCLFFMCTYVLTNTIKNFITDLSKGTFSSLDVCCLVLTQTLSFPINWFLIWKPLLDLSISEAVKRTLQRIFFFVIFPLKKSIDLILSNSPNLDRFCLTQHRETNKPHFFRFGGSEQMILECSGVDIFIIKFLN